MRKLYTILLNIAFVSMMILLYLLYRHDGRYEREFVENGTKINAVITDNFGVISTL